MESVKMEGRFSKLQLIEVNLTQNLTNKNWGIFVALHSKYERSECVFKNWQVGRLHLRKIRFNNLFVCNLIIRKIDKLLALGFIPAEAFHKCYDLKMISQHL